ncbi:MAG TPA: histidinol-phosphatase HisJ family protein [Firmicutes bacterium]|nr:histidinol-phosphatase HisJ family protein [Candidatus Fermentithermobacillaceae bacterium]
MNSDFHTHTMLSPDSSMTVQQVAEIALSRGLKAVAITDHAEMADGIFGFQSPHCRSYETYRSTVERAASSDHLKGKIHVLLGVEVGYTTGDHALASEFLDSYDFDVVLGSVHNSPPVDWWNPEGGELLRTSPEVGVEALVWYFTQLEAAASSGLFDIIGHIDVYERYHPGLWPNPFTHSKIAPLAKKAVRALAVNCRMEINLDMMNKRGHFAWSAGKFLELYREMGGKPPVAGSDSHRPEYVGLHIRKAEELARKAGFPGLAPWEEVVAKRKAQGRTVLI